MFNHLHLHSEFSLLDGVAKIKDLIGKGKELGFTAMALTDHGNLHGSYEFWKVCKENDIKPIIGAELYLAPRKVTDRVHKMDDKPYHLTVLAKTQQGYRNLIKLVSLAHIEGFYRFPRVDKEMLEKYSEGLVVLSGCMTGIISRNLRQGNYEEAKNEAEYFRNLYGENYYMEVQRVERDESKELAEQTIKLAKELNIPMVATGDVHYVNPDDWELQEIVWAIADGKTLTDPHRRRAWTKELYLKSHDEMVERFKDIPEAIENTQKIADSIEDIDITFDRVQPIYPDIPKGKDAKEILREQTYDGAKGRYAEITQELKDRIDFELELIHEKGYDHYFLVVGDIMQWCRTNDIIVSCRGSVAGSVAAYCLGITNVDPIQWELYFERFLNPERPSPPDIDMDLQDDARDQVMEYISKRYGEKNITAICTFGRLKTRAAIRDVARVMEIDLSIADRLSKMVQVLFGKTKKIDDMIKDDPEFKEIIESDPKLIKLSEYVRKLEGNARHISVHACGYLITPEPVMDYVPLRRESKGGSRIITMHEGPPLEEMGLMKFDFLGLANLTIIKNAIEKVRKKLNKDFNTSDIPFDDLKTYKLYTAGETHGVFQVEGEGMKKYLKKLKPQDMEDICFMLAAYRPGPMQYIEPYINRKAGREEVQYLIPELEPIVGKTYGFAIYQEQVIRIAVDIAGYTMGGADKLRKGMGKKIKEVMDAEAPKFKKGVMKKGHSQEIADGLWEYMLPFADYGFNKAHSASYAVVSYWTAYLKAHFPLEFMAALLEHHLQDVDEVKNDILECERMGITILPPNVNKSDVNFTIEGKNAIRLGLAAIKGVGTNPCQAIVDARKDGQGEFANFDDFLKRVDLKLLNKKTIECLIKVGGFDIFGDRAGLVHSMPILHEMYQKIQKEVEGGQTGLFDGVDTAAGATSSITFTSISPVDPATDAQKLTWEKELLGVYITQHPLKEIYEFTEVINGVDTGDINIDMDGRIIKTVALTNDLKRTFTKKDNKPMAILSLEGLKGKIQAVLFPRIYEKFGHEIGEGDIVYVKGTVTDREGSPNLLINEIKKVDVDKAIQFARKRRRDNGVGADPELEQ